MELGQLTASHIDRIWRMLAQLAYGFFAHQAAGANARGTVWLSVFQRTWNTHHSALVVEFAQYNITIASSPLRVDGNYDADTRDALMKIFARAAGGTSQFNSIVSVLGEMPTTIWSAGDWFRSRYLPTVSGMPMQRTISEMSARVGSRDETVASLQSLVTEYISGSSQPPPSIAVPSAPPPIPGARPPAPSGKIPSGAGRAPSGKIPSVALPFVSKVPSGPAPALTVATISGRVPWMWIGVGVAALGAGYIVYRVVR